MANVAITTGALDVSIRNYYDRLALLTLQNNVVLYQFAEKKPLPAKSGGTIFWDRYTNFTEVSTHLTESSPPSVVALSATAISAVIVQDGFITEISDLVDMTNITDNGKAAVERLAELAGRSIDSYLRREIYNTAASTVPPISANVKNVWGNDSTRGNLSAMQSTSCSMSTSVIRYAVLQLKNFNAKPLIGEDYILCTSPRSSAKLRGDSVWQNANQYSGVYADKIFRGESGRIEGARVVESTQFSGFFASGNSLADPSAAYVSTSDTSVHFSILLGKGCLGVTEMAGGLQTYTVAGPDKSDVLNQKTSYGWKITWVPKTLNYSCGIVIATTD